MKDLHTLVPSQVNLEINFNLNPVKALNPLVLASVAGVRKGRGIEDAVADLGEGPGGPPPPYFRSNRGPKGLKIFFLYRASSLSQGLDDRSIPQLPPPPSYLKVWRRH